VETDPVVPMRGKQGGPFERPDLNALVRAAGTLTLAAALGWVTACSDNPASPCDSCSTRQVTGLIISNPVPLTSLAVGAGAGVATARAIGAPGTVTYISITPGTAPTGARATVKLIGGTGSLSTAMIGGGFDPVAVPANVGDSLVVTATDVYGGTVFQARVAVADDRPPVIVRTEPPARKRDVPLNASIVIVFSEPVDAGTLNSSSVQILQGANSVAGTVAPLPGSGTAVAFTPATPLARNTDYSLVVTTDVKDLLGKGLVAGVTVPFKTGSFSTGAPTSIVLSPDSLLITDGAAHELTATVRDSAGNVLIAQPVTWSTSDPSGLTVSAAGLLTPLAEGIFSVHATLGGLSAYAGVEVQFAGPAASVTLSPSPATVAAGDTIYLVPTVRDAAGHLLRNRPVTWTSSAPTTASVVGEASGLALAKVTGVSPGQATVTGTSGTASGSASITVTAPQAVASVTVTPFTAALLFQGTVALSAALHDAQGRVIIGGRAITWTSDNPAVATVDENGVATGTGSGSALVSATSGGVSGTSAITVTTLRFGAVSAGGHALTWANVLSGGIVHQGRTCGLTTGGAAYCWGSDSHGQLGDGSTANSTVPVPVTGGLIFSEISSGVFHTCGLTTSGAAYCWGSDSLGQLGNGSTSSSPIPVAVTGGLTFSAVTAGSNHSCGLAVNGAAYCWGNNDAGQLGNGSTANSTVPTAVIGGLTFAVITSGHRHTCGVTTDGLAYCWGDNGAGQLGDGSTNSSLAPVAAAGGLSFTALSAAVLHTCGLTADGAAYCWGSSSTGSVPVAVPGGLRFSALALGAGLHTGAQKAASLVVDTPACGVTTSGAAYCGLQAGAVPTAVPGGLTFTSISASTEHTCGLAIDGAVYCWGDNTNGQLGTGTTTSSSTPLKVFGQP